VFPVVVRVCITITHKQTVQD